LMKISVVIVTYNSKPFIDRCLRPLIPHIGYNLEVVVWDNASPDGTFEYLKQYSEIRLFGGTSNLGFAAGNNAAFEYCNGDYLLLLNPDAFLDSVEPIWALARHLDTIVEVAAVGPRLVNADGSHQVGDCGWEHNLQHSVGHFLFLHHIFPRVKSLFLTNASLLNNGLVDVDWICGACMLVRKSAIDRIGPMDSSFFMYSEDAEWGMRMRRNGYRILYEPSVKVLHMQGGTQKSGLEEPFFSTKWLDSLAVLLSHKNNAFTFLAFKITLFLGFFLRGTIEGAKSLLFGSTHRKKAVHMFRYFKHVSSLRYRR
jgi:N-acetylglucosaminyl-diphospho-decaprenol L-rhamnosyltransferase